MSDSGLVGRVRDGTADFAELVREYEPQIHRWLYAQLRNAAEAEELTERVLVQVFEQLKVFNPERGSFYTWLRTIVYNAAVSALRKRRSAPRSLDLMPEAEVPSVAGPEEIYAARLQRARLYLLLKRLDPLERKALVGFHVQHRSWREVAAGLGCCERSARNYAASAVMKLREEL
jgi:RNA polymerase sigma-70 factor (ECF subfamily)